MYGLKQNKVGMGAKSVAYAAASGALVMAATLSGFSTAQFYFNLGDAFILTIAAIFGPVTGALAGGIGSFLADMAVYPVTMFYTLVIKGAEGFLAGIFYKIVREKIKGNKVKLLLNAATTAVPSFLMMTGYFVCQSFMYGTYTSALAALPADAIQATASCIIAFAVLYPLKAIKLRDKLLFNKQEKSNKDSNYQIKDTLTDGLLSHKEKDKNAEK